MNSLRDKAHLIILTIVIFFSQISCKAPVEEKSGNHLLSYDSLLAQKYGADDYGMKKYVLAFLKKGPNRDLDSAESYKLQMAHLQNIDRMAEEGKLVLAGPFFGDFDLRGIYIFNVESIEEAKDLTNSDPAIQAGSLEMELMEWYGSAALVGLNNVHKRISKQNPGTE